MWAWLGHDGVSIETGLFWTIAKPQVFVRRVVVEVAMNTVILNHNYSAPRILYKPDLACRVEPYLPPEIVQSSQFFGRCVLTHHLARVAIVMLLNVWC